MGTGRRQRMGRTPSHGPAEAAKRRWIRGLVTVPAGLAVIASCGLVGLRRPASFTPVSPSLAATTAVVATLRQAVLEPLAREDVQRSAFSRAPMPASARQLRVTSESTTDALGASLRTFAIDERHGLRWQKDRYAGCVYPATGEVYLLEKQGYVAAEKHFRDKGVDASPTVCQGAALPHRELS